MITTPPAARPRRSLFKKQIPTLLGLLILIIGLGIGAVLFSQGTSIFLPRATPQTTPKSIRVSNLTDVGFTITFITDEPTAGFIKYGTDPKKLTQIGDQRDQITGTVGEYTVHQITVARGLDPNTTYYYVLGTGSGSLFDDEGNPFTLKTAKQAGTQPKALTVFGSASLPSGAPAEGAVVFVSTPNAGTLSSLVTAAGSWAVSLSNARTPDGEQYAKVAEGDTLQIQVQAQDPNDNTKTTAVVSAEKSIDIKLGESLASISPSPSPSPQATLTPVASAGGSLTASGSASLLAANLSNSNTASKSATSMTASNSGSLTTAAMAATPAAEIVDLTKPSSEPIVVDSAQPTIIGAAKPNVIITFEVHSNTQINDTVKADANGQFQINLDEYAKNLEPGEHTVTYSYTDPVSGQKETVTRKFTVTADHTIATAASQTGSTSTTSTSTGTSTGTTNTSTSTSTGTTNTSTGTSTGTSTVAMSTTASTSPYSTSNPYPVATAGTSTRSASSSSTKSPTPRTASGSSKGGTGSGELMSSGSVGITALLIFAGLFFLVSGIWSWWASQELAKAYQEE